MHVVLKKLRSDFTAAISSGQNELTLDTSIASLIDRISGTEFLEAFSIYSRGHLRKLGDHLGEITNVHLKAMPSTTARSFFWGRGGFGSGGRGDGGQSRALAIGRQTGADQARCASRRVCISC
jgi:hypothetical protein